MVRDDVTMKWRWNEDD